jgi:hypothetical protein
LLQSPRNIRETSLGFQEEESHETSRREFFGTGAAALIGLPHSCEIEIVRVDVLVTLGTSSEDEVQI